MSQTRMTKQRSIILEVQRGVTSHPTADEIYGMVRKKLPRISLGTVYRNLDLLTSSGEILCLNRAGAQKRFDGRIGLHHHIRCTSCGKVGDVFSPVPLPDTSAVIPGFSVHGVEVEFVGLCDSCRTGAGQRAF